MNVFFFIGSDIYMSLDITQLQSCSTVENFGPTGRAIHVPFTIGDEALEFIHSLIKGSEPFSIDCFFYNNHILAYGLLRGFREGVRRAG